VLLSSCLFLVMCSYKIGGVAGNALFLSRFQARQLGYVQIACTVLVMLVVAGYMLIARRVLLRDLLVGSMMFFSTTWALFWGLAHYYSHLIWVFPAFYIWVKVFGVLGATQIWTLANYVLTTREAKRVFGMVGGAAIAGAIDRKSTRLNSSHGSISYAVFCLKKKKLPLANSAVLIASVAIFRQVTLHANRRTDPECPLENCTLVNAPDARWTIHGDDDRCTLS